MKPSKVSKIERSLAQTPEEEEEEIPILHWIMYVSYVKPPFDGAAIWREAVRQRTIESLQHFLEQAEKGKVIVRVHDPNAQFWISFYIHSNICPLRPSFVANVIPPGGN